MPNYIKRAFIAVGFLGVMAACGGETGGDSGQTRSPSDASTRDTGPIPMGSPKACTVDTDCGAGEIDHEIRSRADCICLFGCPYLPLSRTTIARRSAQHAALCDPLTNASGQPCPVDDCARPPSPVCTAGECTFPRD